MGTEDLSPSPEEMGIDSDEKLKGSPTSKETGQKESDLFEKFVSKDKDGVLPPGYEVVDLEKEKLFVIIKRAKEYDDDFRRIYFAQAVEQESEEISFQEVAEAYIEENRIVEFTKTGRPSPGRYFNETETLRFTSEYREDKNEFDLVYGLTDIKQDDRGSDETGRTSLDVVYDPQGNLILVFPKHKDIPHGSSFTSYGFEFGYDNTEAMEELRQAAEEGRTLEANGVKLGVAYSPDRKNFIFTMYDKQGEEDFTVTVPLSVNVTEIMEETGALNLLRNPTQPSEGVQGQGVGDTDWRYKSFSELTGVKLTTAKL